MQLVMLGNWMILLKENKNGPILEGLNWFATFFRAVGAEITQERGDFFVSNVWGDADKPTEGFSLIEDGTDNI